MVDCDNGGSPGMSDFLGCETTGPPRLKLRTFMAQAGGSANINGILYQILGTLGRACAARIEDAQIENDDVLSVRLTIEPQGGGGDLQIEVGLQRRVEQWKAKSGGGTWSLAKIIDEVLPDLYRALPDDFEKDLSVYAFVTEAKIGNWKAAYELFHALPGVASGDSVETRLDDASKRHKIGTTQYSDRNLISHIVRALTGTKGNRADLLARERRVCHLLRHFEVQPPLSLDRLISQINTTLRNHLNDFADDDAKRRELCGALLELAAVGNVTITAEQLLKKAGLPLQTFRSWRRLCSRMRERLNQQLEKQNYDHALDVRPHLVRDGQVTAISGEGGQGKTWQLARFASEVSQSDALSVWVPSARLDKDAAAIAASEIWNYGLERDPKLSLDRIAEHRLYANPDAALPWAVVCIDDVNTLDEARYICGLDWKVWGIRCVFTTNVEIGQAIESQGIAAHVPLSDFATSELHRYLELRGKEWRSIAPDVEQLIRRPILANVYANSIQAESWRPENEYEVIEAFWNALSDPLDKAALRALAATLAGDNPQYPWSGEMVLECGMTRETVQRLIDAGWLKDMGDGAFAVWHQRLLAWAFAEAVCAQFKHSQLTIEKLGELLVNCSNDTIAAASRRVSLGYAPMDVLWLLFGAKNGIPIGSELWRLILSLERHGGYGHRDDVLYNELLGTLGPRAIPHLVERVRNSGNSDGNLVPKLTTAALSRIGRIHRGEIARIAASCVKAREPALLELGLRLTAKFPDNADLDKLWQIHKARVVSEKPVSERYREQEISQAAFRAAVATNVSWLERTLVSYKADSALSELVYTLANTSHPDFKELWQRQKEWLLNSIPAPKVRCLVICIVRFRDSAEQHRLEDWASSDEEFVGPTALQALALFDPVRTAQLLAAVTTKKLIFSAGAIGTSLLTTAPAETCKSICERLSAFEEQAMAYALLVKGHGDTLDRATIESLLELLDDVLSAFQSSEQEGANPVLWRPLELIVSLHGVEILRALRDRQGTDFESRLADYACARADNNSGYVDHEYEFAQSLLKRIAGNGYTRLINALLSATARQSKMTGCEEAVVRPDKSTLELLRDAAMSDALWDSGSSAFPVVQQRAIDSLATLARNRDLIDAITMWGAKISPYVSELRAGQPPMADKDFATAIDLLQKPNHPQHANAILAIGQTGRKDLENLLQQLFQHSAQASDVALNSVLALEDLSDDFTPILDRLANQYRSGHHKFAVLKAVLKSPATIPIEYFFSLLPENGQYDDIDERLLSYLAHQEASRDKAIELIRAHFDQDGKHRFLTFLDASSLLDPKHPIDRERLWHRTRWPREAIFSGGSKAIAIRRIAETEPQAAYEAALETFLQNGPDRYDMSDVLIRIDKGRAMNDLCQGIAASTDKALCRQVAITIRRQELQTQLAGPLLSVLSNENWRARRAAAKVSGYIGGDAISSELNRLIFNDADWDVCTEAQLALRAIQRESEATKLIDTLPSLKPAEVWGTLDCVCHLADPDILALPVDPLRFLAYLDTTTFAIRRYVSKLLEKKRKEIEQDFKSIHNRWDRDQ